MQTHVCTLTSTLDAAATEYRALLMTYTALLKDTSEYLHTGKHLGCSGNSSFRFLTRLTRSLLSYH